MQFTDATHHARQSPQSVASTRGAPQRITAQGDMTVDARVLDFNQRCISSLNRPISRLIVDVADVTHSDTKLIAVLISLYANCRRKHVVLELHLSQGVINWLGIYDLKWLAEMCMASPDVDRSAP